MKREEVEVHENAPSPPINEEKNDHVYLLHNKRTLALSPFLLLLTSDQKWFRKETLQTSHEDKKEPCMSRLAFHFLRYLDRHLISMLNFQYFIHNPHRFCSSHVNEHSVVYLWKDNKNEKRHKRYSWVYYATKKRKIQKSKNNGSGFIVRKRES